MKSRDDALLMTLYQLANCVDFKPDSDAITSQFMTVKVQMTTCNSYIGENMILLCVKYRVHLYLGGIYIKVNSFWGESISGIWRHCVQQKGTSLLRIVEKQGHAIYTVQ